MDSRVRSVWVEWILESTKQFEMMKDIRIDLI